jgi:hypothetical protein
MGVGNFSSPLRGVGVLPTPDAGLDTTCHIETICEVPLGACVLQLRIYCAAGGVFIVRHRGLDGVQPKG